MDDDVAHGCIEKLEQRQLEGKNLAKVRLCLQSLVLRERVQDVRHDLVDHHDDQTGAVRSQDVGVLLVFECFCFSGALARRQF